MPTVFDGVSNDMRIAREEIFGPVVSIIPFDTEEEALRLANATPYGLSGSIWSRDIGKALRAAKALQAGVISVNSNSVGPHRGAVRRLQDVGHRARARDVRARPLHRDQERLHRPELIAGDARGPGRRRSSQSRSAHVVVLKAIPAHGIVLGREGDDLGRLGRRGAVPPTIRASKAMVTTRRLEPRVEADDLARLDEQAGLLPGLADGRLVDRLVDLEEAARLGPRALARLDAAPDQDDLAGVGDREGRDDEPRVDVDDVAARRRRRAGRDPRRGPRRSAAPPRSASRS